MQEEVKRLAEKKESLTSARDNYSTRSDEWVGKSNSSPCSLEQRIIELYAELVQGNIYVNLINKEMEKTRQELDQGNVTVQKLQKRWIHSPSRNNEPKPPLKQASKISCTQVLYVLYLRLLSSVMNEKDDDGGNKCLILLMEE